VLTKDKVTHCILYISMYCILRVNCLLAYYAVMWIGSCQWTVRSASQLSAKTHWLRNCQDGPAILRLQNHKDGCIWPLGVYRQF